MNIRYATFRILRDLYDAESLVAIGRLEVRNGGVGSLGADW